MYQSNLINDYLDTLFLCYSNLKDLIDNEIIEIYFIMIIVLFQPLLS